MKHNIHYRAGAIASPAAIRFRDNEVKEAATPENIPNLVARE